MGVEGSISWEPSIKEVPVAIEKSGSKESEELLLKTNDFNLIMIKGLEENKVDIYREYKEATLKKVDQRIVEDSEEKIELSEGSYILFFEVEIEGGKKDIALKL